MSSGIKVTAHHPKDKGKAKVLEKMLDAKTAAQAYSDDFDHMYQEAWKAQQQDLNEMLFRASPLCAWLPAYEAAAYPRWKVWWYNVEWQCWGRWYNKYWRWLHRDCNDY